MAENQNLPAELYVRIRDENRAMHPRQKRPSDNTDAQKERNEKRKRSESSRQRGRLEFYYGSEDEKIALFNKMDKIKIKLGQGKVSNTSTYNVLNSVFDYYLENNSTAQHNEDAQELTVPSYQHVDFDESLNEEMFLCSLSSLDNLIKRVTNHTRQCAKQLHVKEYERLRHAVRLKINCEHEHCLKWYSSPHLEGGKLLVNLKMAHGLFTSGILPEHYEKLCNAAGIGVLGDAYMASLQPGYCELVKELTVKSQEDALKLEIAMSVDSELQGGIGIMTDARHCWRRNAQFSDVVCIGDLSHKVLRVETISKEDDTCSQRHELLGVDRIYKYLDENNCPVLFHAHDNNASVSKYVRERGDTDNANDTWHLAKGIAKGAKKIAGGRKKTHGIDWHWELKDKAGSIKTHIFWCMKNCKGNAEKLRSSINNIVAHYKNDHSICHETSRCRQETHYIGTKVEIKDPAAEKILRDFLQKLPVYRQAEVYALCKDTHYVESFNNALLQYVDKRIVFGKDSYIMRINIAVLDWNENIDRPVTSRQFREDVRNPRRTMGRPVHKKKTYDFKSVLWIMWMESLYGETLLF